MDGYDGARIDRFHRVSRTDWPHGEMIADAYQHDIDPVVISDARNVGKESGVAGVIKGWAIANADDQSARVSRINRRRNFVLCHARSMPRRHKTNHRITIESSEVPTDTARCAVDAL